MLPQCDICTGCGACAAVCPYNCILMTADSEGFRYPVIDRDKCAQCGACERSCPICTPLDVNDEPAAKAVQNVDETVRAASSSGGVFTALAEDVLAKGGAVCAAVYDSDFSVCHILVDSTDQLAMMRGAKYAQSKAEHCFSQIRDLLKKDLPVLFVGTPCQVAGLQAYLGRDYEALLLVDMVCHGVPSPSVWKQYLAERKQRDAAGSGLLNVELRSKTTGWSHYGYSVEMRYEDGTVYSIPQGKDLFMRGFVSNLYLRPSCETCRFKGIQRTSDLTLGDFWGIWDQYPDFDDNKGTSLLLIHTEKGRNAWDQISNQFRSIDVTAQEAVAQNPSAVQASCPHINRGRFFSKMDRVKSLEQWISQCLVVEKESSVRRLLRRLHWR